VEEGAEGAKPGAAGERAVGEQPSGEGNCMRFTVLRMLLRKLRGAARSRERTIGHALTERKIAG
jgi:hypothetical protein